MIFDKTGTLTAGKPSVTDEIVLVELDEGKIYIYTYEICTFSYIGCVIKQENIFVLFSFFS